MKYLLDLGSHVCLAVLNGEFFFQDLWFLGGEPRDQQKKGQHPRRMYKTLDKQVGIFHKGITTYRNN